MVKPMPASEAGKIEVGDVGDVGDASGPRSAGAEDKVGDVGDAAGPRFAGAGVEDKVGDVCDDVFAMMRTHRKVAGLLVTGLGCL
jgi:hypothetical protein